MNKPVKIAVLGSGNVGSTLGAKWLAAGHPVHYGVRNAASPKSRAVQDRGGGVKLDTMENAIRSGDVVVFAIPNSGVAETLARYGGLLDGKIVVDATNRFGEPVVNHIAEIQASAPQAVVYRAFNSLGWENFAEPRIGGVQIDLFYCGPAGESQEIVEQLIAEIGLRPVRVGGIETALLVDSVGSLWMTLVFGQHRGRHMAFRLLER
jgi:8-hydroxy-5-deazaflavin:NADPH oxidoreductase